MHFNINSYRSRADYTYENLLQESLLANIHTIDNSNGSNGHNKSMMKKKLYKCYFDSVVLLLLFLLLSFVEYLACSVCVLFSLPRTNTLQEQQKKNNKKNNNIIAPHHSISFATATINSEHRRKCKP